jgi:hypothetical protein
MIQGLGDMAVLAFKYQIDRLHLHGGGVEMVVFLPVNLVEYRHPLNMVAIGFPAL